MNFYTVHDLESVNRDQSTLRCAQVAIGENPAWLVDNCIMAFVSLVDRR